MDRTVAIPEKQTDGQLVSYQACNCMTGGVAEMVDNAWLHSASKEASLEGGEAVTPHSGASKEGERARVGGRPESGA